MDCKVQKVAVGLWADGAVAGLEDMTIARGCHWAGCREGSSVQSQNDHLLVFVLDFKNGRIHSNLRTVACVQRIRFSLMRPMSVPMRRTSSRNRQRV